MCHRNLWIVISVDGQLESGSISNKVAGQSESILKACLTSKQQFNDSLNIRVFSKIFIRMHVSERISIYSGRDVYCIYLSIFASW